MVIDEHKELVALTTPCVALIVGIIEMAVRDATAPTSKPQHMVEAWAYFTGPTYRQHLEWLGVSPFRLPDGLKASI